LRDAATHDVSVAGALRHRRTTSAK
jgi:hypothetical protein